MTRYDGMFKPSVMLGQGQDDFIVIKRSDIFEMEHQVGYAHSPRGIEHKFGCTHYIELKSGSRCNHVLREELDGLHAHWIPKTELGIKKVLYSGPATIVFWNDGTKTVVKCAEGDDYTPEVGLAMAISKKVLGNRYSNVFRKYCVSEAEECDVEVSIDKDRHTVVTGL